MRMIALVLAILVTHGASAENNLLLNGRFERDQTEAPLGWETPLEAKIGEAVFYEQGGGPNGIPCVRCVNRSRTPRSFTFRQQAMTFVPGSRYRLSLRVKAKDFAGECRAIVINASWKKECGMTDFPSESEWVRKELEFDMIGSADPKRYSAAVRLIGFTGEFSFADFRLEPLDEAAVKGSSPAGGGNVPRFFPWSPRLCDIDAASRQMEFRFEGRLPGGEEFAAYRVRFTTPAGSVEQPLVSGVNGFVLPVGCDEGKLDYAIIRKGTDVPLLSGRMPFRVRQKHLVDTRAHRRLNNLVTEVLSEDLSAEDSPRDFCTTRDGYVFVRTVPARTGSLALSVDGRPVVTSETPRHEAFCELPRGRHVLTASGCGQTVVRQVATLFSYPLCKDSSVGENGSYGLEFFRRYVKPNCIVMDGGHPTEAELACCRAGGGKWLTNTSIHPLKDDDMLVGNISANKMLALPTCDGTTLDEAYFGKTESLEPYIAGLRKYMATEDPDGKLIWTWMTGGKPVLPGLDREAIALAMNVSGGRGRALSEIYCRTKNDEESARRYLEDYAKGTVARYAAIYPGAISSVGVGLGVFTQIPYLTLWYSPEVDYKRYIDMQMRFFATDPAFDGLGTIGFWGTCYCDEDIHRWLFALMRHYCIEGQTEGLSERYGFRYRPEILANGDFRTSLEGWLTSGAVTRKTIEKLGESAESRWWDEGSGDSFAALTKESGKTSWIGRMLQNLVPGRQYVLDVVAFDVKDAEAGVMRPARHPISIVLCSGARVDERLSWVHIDRRTKEQIRIPRYRGARVNRHHVVFTAMTERIFFSIDNSTAPDGSELGVNWIGCWPRFEEVQ